MDLRSRRLLVGSIESLLSGVCLDEQLVLEGLRILQGGTFVVLKGSIKI